MAPRKPNDNQRKAIHWGDGPLLVLAGPGAGKTFVLTERLVRLIEESSEDFFGILALTFTNKAAAEMRDRVGNRLGSESQRVEIATFHSFCLGMLRQHGSHIGLRTDFQLLTEEADRVAFLRTVASERGFFSTSGLTTEHQARVLGRLMQSDHAEAAAPMEAADAPSGFRQGPWVSAYVDSLIAENTLDFAALLVCGLRLLRKNPAVAELVRTTYPYLCVDEYQDTNEVQDRLLRLLSPPPGGNLFVVADDDQIIYEWNGANPRRLADLHSDYRMTVVELPESFRCPAEVLTLANRLIARNRVRVRGKKPLTGVADRSRGAVYRLREFPDEAGETRWIADDFSRRRLPAAGCVVLGRTNRLVERAHQAFDRQGIPAFWTQRKSAFESPGMRFVSAALRLAVAPADMTQLRRLSKAFFDATQVLAPVDHSATLGDARAGSLLAGFVEVAAAESQAPAHKALGAAVCRHLVERLDHRGFVEAAFSLFDSEPSGFTWSEAVRNATREEAARWRELDAEITAATGGDLPLPQLLQEFDLRPIGAEPGPEQVRCMTIHQAKGKEFDHVYLMGLAEDQLPSHYAKNNGENGRQIEEERRNCFVAITRASETLTLTYARSYFGWPKERSRFLADMGLPPDETVR